MNLCQKLVMKTLLNKQTHVGDLIDFINLHSNSSAESMFNIVDFVCDNYRAFFASKECLENYVNDYAHKINYNQYITLLVILEYSKRSSATQLIHQQDCDFVYELLELCKQEAYIEEDAIDSSMLS